MDCRQLLRGRHEVKLYRLPLTPDLINGALVVLLALATVRRHGIHWMQRTALNVAAIHAVTLCES